MSDDDCTPHQVLYHDAVEVMKIMMRFKYKTSILDDFGFYDRKAQKLKERKERLPAASSDPDKPKPKARPTKRS
jgi:hypothetical protein